MPTCRYQGTTGCEECTYKDVIRAGEILEPCDFECCPQYSFNKLREKVVQQESTFCDPSELVSAGFAKRTPRGLARNQ